jgi:hypothetical protein
MRGATRSASRPGKLLANWAGNFSPSQLNPFDLNSLRHLLERRVDFEQLRAQSVKVVRRTTQANTGKLRECRESELTVVLLAFACQPMIHHGVEIDGEPYWDGGYSANPAAFPLFYGGESRDVLLVLLRPLKREGTPLTVEEIEARIVELAFGANFVREMRMFAHAAEFFSTTFMTMGRLERRLQKMTWQACGPPTPSCLHTVHFSSCCEGTGASGPMHGFRMTPMASDDDQRLMQRSGSREPELISLNLNLRREGSCANRQADRNGRPITGLSLLRLGQESDVERDLWNVGHAPRIGCSPRQLGRPHPIFKPEVRMPGLNTLKRT